jgi:tetratricopeptide (TPR) repeat protein
MEDKTMKKLTIFILTLFICGGISAQNPKKSYKNGLKLIETNQYAEAIEEFNQAIDLNAAYTEAYVARAGVYEKMDNIELAVKDYERAVELAPTIVDYIFEAGKNNYKIKNYDKALKYLTEAVTLDNKHFQAFQFKSFTHIKLEEYKKAVLAIDQALAIEKTYICFYTRGVANDSLGNFSEAILDYNKAIGLNPNFEKSYYALTKTYIRNNEIDNALQNAERSVQKFPTSPEAYEARSLAYYSKGDLPAAINDLSKLETLIENHEQVLLTRGLYYFEYNQYQNAKSDFTRLIALAPNNYQAVYWRGRANEELMESSEAAKDYLTYLDVSEKIEANALVQKDAKLRLFEINRENNAPLIVIDTPLVMPQYKLGILNNADRIIIEGKIEDQSNIASLTINQEAVKVEENFNFSHSVNIAGIKLVILEVQDVYGNVTKVEYDLVNMEADAPVVRITTPYAGDNNEIYLDSKDANLFVEGVINDASPIKDIYVDSIRASFKDTELNPQFSASINIQNKNSITIKAIDGFGNTVETKFTLNREGALIAESNPMGKTWVVFIENSNYDTFASLEGPTKDVSSMKSALSNYEIHNFIHKKDMSKKEMERFFSIELRDQVKKNNVNSLMVWYAGHGKFINETGYWIPVDATRDDEFTYFNINSLKAGMQSYSNYITHTLVVTDACESGPSFYQAMRSTGEIRQCDDINATKFKSSQVFSSAGYELASDNSQFTKTFAKSLQFNENSCIPIETIVSNVTAATATNENQKPLFGKIAGFEDENGTFFFIKK